MKRFSRYYKSFVAAGVLILVPLLSKGAIATWNFDSGTDNNTAYAGGATYGVNVYDHSRLTTPAPSLGATASGGVSRGAGTGNGGVALAWTASGGANVTGNSFTLTLKAATALSSFSIT